MAEALVSFLLEQLGSIVVGEFVLEVKLIESVEKEVESLTATLTMIQAVLKDADEKQVKNEAVKLWLEQLKDSSYDVDDVLDEWFTRTLLSKLQTPEVNAQIKENECSIFFSLVCCLKPVVLRHEVGVKIKELNERLDGIAKKKDMYNLTEIRSEKESRPMTSSVVDVSDILGRNDDKEIIVSKLLSESSSGASKVPIISIVGTGGFGKTTLAKLILKEEKVINYFEKQLWVCVSDPFDYQMVAKQIIEAATGEVIETVSWEALLKHLSESINGKRFILVLDDVWSYNAEDWYQLKTSLDGGATGSRIIVTTRDEKIAKLMDSTYIHWLGQLSDDDSWLMFKSIAFRRREDDLEFLEDVAKDITHKCKGVPISIKVLASAMRLEKNIQGWRSVQANNIWNFQERGVGFLPSILFSYYAVPAELKPCLVHCAILPKDSKIKKKEIVELWMAQGYLGYDGSKDLDIKGGHYFDDLAMRSFFQDFEKDSKGNIICCKMHDLVHDIVQFLSESETCILEKPELKSDNIRHLTTLNFNIPSIYKLKKLRTLRPVDDRLCPSKITDLGLLHELACLRVLDLSYSNLTELPSGVGRLLHLRYLNLSVTKLVELPETICNLLNLQTLKLGYCTELAKLPKGLGMLCNLRHLIIKGTHKLEYLPQGFRRLIFLRTLDVFIIDDGEGCNISELKLLNHLQGELEIRSLGKMANPNNAAEAELEKKKNLQSLILSFSEEEEENGDEKILEGLLPHNNLEELKVLSYRGTKFPVWISSSSSLVKLELNMLKHLSHLPGLGMLHFLEVLVLQELKMVKRIGEEFYGLNGCCGGRRDLLQHQSQQIIFPKLKKLHFANMNAWEEWDLPYQNDNNIDFFPNLIELKISECNIFQALPPGLGKLKSVESLQLSGMEGLKCLISRQFCKILSKGNDDDNGEFFKQPPTEVVLFPSLTSLSLYKTKEEMTPDFEMDSTTSIAIMPHLGTLKISYFPKLKVIPFYLFSDALRELVICNCPQLTGMQLSLPPLLEKLKLGSDVGVLNSSLLSLLHNSCYPNLHYLEILYSSQSFLPQGLNLLTSIQQLYFGFCEFLDFMPDKLKPFTMLEQLEISHCPILAQRFKVENDYHIIIRLEQLAEIEKSFQSDVCGHISVYCDNCQMEPIVGKRYRCKDCWQEHIRTSCDVGFDLCEECYHTRSNNPDLVNQHHHTLGHTFELIANPGDIPVHPDETSEDAEGVFVGPKPAEIEDHNKG